ncbi:protein-L-isoaspartate(D-aspartate) O-methyltransferase [Aquabacterium humicola]|uniref:protein-L-isoaspartate(D-aspartate) O-methyltransferase n=1 Tax=Aquabacterium humicola TaxID=3237377 RepID=UPI002542F679|nr:protein-L-isoaspartate(D-aspartate) O-methyltransferase [Rubrivivax pictus]
MSESEFAELRQSMIAEIVAMTVFSCGQLDKAALQSRVLDAIGEVPRHLFVPPLLKPLAYLNRPLPIGCDKTISQPFIVAVMTDLLDPRPSDRVLEIGTGLGYQCAVLSALVQRVYSIELIELLAHQAERRLADAGCRNVVLRIGDGNEGWPEQAPFDKIMVTAAPEHIPPALIAQLKPGGRLVLPAGPPDAQRLIVVQKALDGTLAQRELLPVRFSQLDTAAPH